MKKNIINFLAISFLSICNSTAYADNFYDYKSSYIQDDNISVRNVENLRRNMGYHDVIKKIGPAVEKIEKNVKLESVWKYLDYSLTFKKGLLQAININPDSELFQRVTLDQSLAPKQVKTAPQTSEAKINPKIQGLLKDFGLAESKR